jgi:hypothetical protein
MADTISPYAIKCGKPSSNGRVIVMCGSALEVNGMLDIINPALCPEIIDNPQYKPQRMSNETYMLILNIYQRLGSMSYANKTALERKLMEDNHKDLTTILQEDGMSISQALEARGLAYINFDNVNSTG